MADRPSKRELSPGHRVKMAQARAEAKKKREGLASARSKAAKESHKSRAKRIQREKEAAEASTTNGFGNDSIVMSMDDFYKEVDYDKFNDLLKDSLEQAGVDADAEEAKMAEIEAKITSESKPSVVGFMSPPPTTYTIPVTNAAAIIPVAPAPTVMVMSNASNTFCIPSGSMPSTSFVLNGNYEVATAAGNQFDENEEQYNNDSWTLEALKKELIHKNKVIKALKSKKPDRSEPSKRPSKPIGSFKTRALQQSHLQKLYETNAITAREAFSLVPASLTADEEASLIFNLGISEHRRAYLKRQLGELGLDILAPTKEFHEVYTQLCSDAGYAPPVEEVEDFLGENILDDPEPPPKSRKRSAKAQDEPTNDHHDLE